MERSPEKSPKTITRRSFLQGLGGIFASHWALSSTVAGGAGILARAEHDTRTLKKNFGIYPILLSPLHSTGNVLFNFPTFTLNNFP